MFIELTTAFKTTEEPDYQELGIAQSMDWEALDWHPIYINPEYITSVCDTGDGYTNIDTATGVRYTVKETVVEILTLCNDFG